jgi:multidrug efflux pump subunit AcrA (membrane-fusion protein)
LEAIVNLPENRVEDVRDAARVTVWGGTASGYAVKLRELSPSADSITRTYQARFTIRAPGTDVAIGRTVTIHLDSTPTRPIVTVPLTAVRQQDGRPAVWRVDGDRLVSVPVVMAGYRDDEAVIADGRRAGDAIVAAGG